MSLERSAVESLIGLIRQWYPGWNNISDPKFQADEVQYKRDAMEKAREIIGRNALEELLNAREYDEFIARVDKAAHLSNLLFLSRPSVGDLRVMNHPGLDRPQFCQAMFDLMYGDGAGEERLQRYADFVDARGLPNYWTFPTYFLYFCHPDTELFVKPAVTQRFLKVIGATLPWQSKSSGAQYQAIKQVAEAVLEAFRPYGATDMVDVQSIIWTTARIAQEQLATPERRSEFQDLFEQCLTDYPSSSAGRQHAESYAAGRRVAQANYAEVCAAADSGEDVTSPVLLKLLPYADSQRNREAGAWIHWAPTINGDIKKWYEAKGWTNPGDWPGVARAILSFVRRCVDSPDELRQACADFSALPLSKGFQAGTLTPILNALRPDDFALVNNKSLALLNHFAGKKYAQSLDKYAEANGAFHQLVDELGDILAQGDDLGLDHGDLFDMFSHWLISVKKYDLKPSRYWKIAPGEGGWQWEECLEGGFIAIGWDELGDLSAVSRSAFDTLVQEHKAKQGWSKQALEQVWRFAKHIREGDRILANRGTSELLGVGTVVGPYYFVPGVRHGHRLPVEWDDTTPRRIEEGGWRMTLAQTDRAKFDQLLAAPEIQTDGENDKIAVHTHTGSPFSARTFELI